MSTAKDRSIGQELVRIIRAEIRAYDERKDEAVRLRKVADQAVAEADRAAKAARESTPDPISAAIGAVCGIGDTNAQAIDALLQRQGKPHVDVATTVSTASVDELLRQQRQQLVADGLGAWQTRDTGENPPRRRWWRKKR